MNFAINSIFILLIGIFNSMHPVHVSITNMDYIAEENKVTLSFKVFEDDIQLLFNHLYQINIDFNNPESLKKYQNKVDEYFSTHFEIRGEQPYTLSFQKIKKENDSIWFYYETKIDANPKNFEIRNTLFLDLYFDQKNMLIFTYNEFEKGYLFNLNQTKQMIILNDF